MDEKSRRQNENRDPCLESSSPVLEAGAERCGDPAAFVWHLDRGGLPLSDCTGAELVLPFESVESERYAIGLRADGSNTYYAEMEWDMGWRTGRRCKTVPAVDGICYMPLLGLLSPTEYGGFAVQESGADASLTLILGESEYGSGGRFPLFLVEAQDGWLMFSFGRYLYWHDSSYSDEELRSIRGWAKTLDVWKSEPEVPASLELVTRDADGNVLKEISWDLP